MWEVISLEEAHQINYENFSDYYICRIQKYKEITHPRKFCALSLYDS